MDYTLEWFHHFAIDPSKFTEGLYLLLKDCNKGLNRIALFEVRGERMVDQFLGLLFISLLDSLEEKLERGVRRVIHITLSGRGDGNGAYDKGLEGESGRRAEGQGHCL